VGRGGRPGGGARSAAQQPVEARCRQRPAADEQERAHQHAHHVPQEGVGLDAQHQLVVAPGPLARGHGAVEEDVLAARRREGAEVMAADDAGGGGGHRAGVQRAGVVEHPRPPQRRRGPGEDAVLVAARGRVAAGVEARRGVGDGAGAEVWGQQAGEPAQDPLGGQVARRGDARHLPAGVDAGVGAPGHRQLERAPQQGAERLAKNALGGAEPRLGGPAGEPRPVVLKVEPDDPQLSRRPPISGCSEPRSRASAPGAPSRRRRPGAGRA
jgi:hypothetical protein